MIIKNFINIPVNIDIKILNNIIYICGNLGKINQKYNKYLNIEIINNILYVNSKYLNIKKFKIHSIINTTIKIINNNIIGVTKGYSKNLLLNGIGYKFDLIEDKKLVLFLGFSHPIYYYIPSEVYVILKSSTNLIVKGINKQLVGKVSSEIRNFKKPDKYKAKGIRYYNEKILIKEQKKIK